MSSGEKSTICFILEKLRTTHPATSIARPSNPDTITIHTTDVLYVEAKLIIACISSIQYAYQTVFCKVTSGEDSSSLWCCNSEILSFSYLLPNSSSNSSSMTILASLSEYSVKASTDSCTDCSLPKSV